MKLAVSALVAHRSIRRRRGLLVLWIGLGLFVGGFSGPATGQWLNYPSPGIPRTPDGKPNLSAPAPRTPDGRPDLFRDLGHGSDQPGRTIRASAKK
jgi:hypothetical protein